MLVLLVAGLVAGAAVGAHGSTPVSNVSIQDPTGDAGSGPDITALAGSVSGGTLTLSVTFANRSSLQTGESVQFFVTTPAGGSLNIASYSWGETDLSDWTNGAWETIHELQGTWAGDTFTVADSLDDLQSAVHSPVTPFLDVQVDSYVGASGDTLSQVDAAPNSGFLPVPTVAGTATTTPATTTAPKTTSTPPQKKPTPTPPTRGTKTRPYLSQTVRRLSGHRVEWTKFAVAAVPVGSTVAMGCTKGCSITEVVPVSGHVASSKAFIDRPLGRGATFVTKVLAANGTGYWFRSTVTGKTKPATALSQGCIAKGGALVSLARC